MPPNLSLFVLEISNWPKHKRTCNIFHDFFSKHDIHVKHKDNNYVGLTFTGSDEP